MQTAPLPVQTPISQSRLTKVFDIPGSVLYRAEVITPDRTTKIFEHVRAYTESIQVAQDGRVTVRVDSKDSKKKAYAPYPYHYLDNDKVLCVLKINNMRTQSDEDGVAFALNYDLFDINWAWCIVVHNVGQQRLVFFTSRAEWDRGSLEAHNREVQMFLRVPKERNIPLGMAAVSFNKGITDWLVRVDGAMTAKGV